MEPLKGWNLVVIKTRSTVPTLWTIPLVLEKKLMINQEKIRFVYVHIYYINNKSVHKTPITIQEKNT